MIGPNDSVKLAPGVLLEGDQLRDTVRNVAVELTASGATAAAHDTPARMATALADAFPVEHDRAARDARSFCASLNGALLANVHVNPLRLLARWLVQAAASAPYGRLPVWPARRHAVSTQTAMRAFATVARGAWGAASVVAALIALPLLVLDPISAATAGAAAGTGIVLHEAGHAVALRGVPAALVVRAVRVAVLHPRLPGRREAAVAAAGPTAVLVASVVSAGFVHATAVPLAAASPVLALHGLALTMLGADGRKICAAC